MFDRKELKDRAKLVMLRSYSKMFLACLITYLLAGGGFGISTKRLNGFNLSQFPHYKVVAIYTTVSLLGLIAIIVSIFVLEPLKVGLKKFMLENSRANAELNVLMIPFQKQYKNVVLVTFVRKLFIMLWAIIGLIPTIVFFIAYTHSVSLQSLIWQVEEKSIMAALLFFLIIFTWSAATVIFSIPAIIKTLQYSMVSYLVADNLNINWKTALNESKEMMVGNKWGYVKLVLSFVPWYILGMMLCCGVGIYLLIPYIEATFAELYIELSGQNIKYDGFGEY